MPCHGIGSEAVLLSQLYCSPDPLHLRRTTCATQETKICPGSLKLDVACVSL